MLEERRRRHGAVGGNRLASCLSERLTLGTVLGVVRGYAARTKERCAFDVERGRVAGVTLRDRGRGRCGVTLG
jgi:hypothetical protein